MPNALRPGDVFTLTITRLGGLGDGVGEHNGYFVYVPFALPGERVRAEVTSTKGKECRVKLLETEKTSPDRQAPPCSYFGQCGGCSLQHLSPQAYRRFKMAQMEALLARLGVAREALREMVEVGAGGRRRAELKVQVHKGEVALGFYAARSHDLVDVNDCPVLEEGLSALIVPLKHAIASLKQSGNVLGVKLTGTEAGVAVLMNLRQPPKPADKEKLAAFAQAQGLAQLAWETEAGAQRLYGGELQLRLGEALVEIPSRAFLQASAAAQAAITSIVTEHLASCRHIADLYAGCGTYSFPLVAAGAKLHAFEGDAAMVAAMENACRRYGLEESLQVAQRDLFAAPLAALQLAGFDGAVINPPRNGALPQAEALAASNLRRVAMVSCNPASFERDARALLASGFHLQTLTPIDQFHWSAHLELVACFRRP